MGPLQRDWHPHKCNCTRNCTLNGNIMRWPIIWDNFVFKRIAYMPKFIFKMIDCHTIDHTIQIPQVQALSLFSHSIRTHGKWFYADMIRNIYVLWLSDHFEMHSEYSSNRTRPKSNICAMYANQCTTYERCQWTETKCVCRLTIDATIHTPFLHSQVNELNIAMSNTDDFSSLLSLQTNRTNDCQPTEIEISIWKEKNVRFFRFVWMLSILYFQSIHIKN